MKRYQGFYLFKKTYALKVNDTIFYETISPAALFFSFCYNPHINMHMDLAGYV